MPTTKLVPVKDLELDLGNYRTVPQRGETAAIQAMIAVNAEWFWALTDSLLDSGYLPTENIIVLKGSRAEPQLVVKEGNRRVAILKMAIDGTATTLMKAAERTQAMRIALPVPTLCRSL